MKKKIIICVSFFVILVVISIGILNHTKIDEQIPKKNDNIEDVVTKLVKYQYDTSVNLSDVEKLTLHEEIIPIDLPLARDSMIGGGTCDNQSCNIYNDAKRFYLGQLTKKIKKEQRYSIVDTDINDTTAKVKIKFKGMYLNRYIYDYESLIQTFTSLSNGKLSETEEYKLEVKALEVLNRNLNEYENEDEEMYVNLFLEKKSGKWHVVDISSFYNQLSGFSYESEKRNNNDNLEKINKEYNDRFQRILNNSKNLLNTKDVYKIKYKGGK